MSISKIVLLALLIIGYAQCHPSCISINGEQVEYYLMRKLPNSTQFIYTDSNKQQIVLPKIQNIPFNHTDSPIIRTISQIDFNQTNIGSVFWNNAVTDQEAIEDNGHSKGIISFDEIQGFILSHSSPFFPTVINDTVSLEVSDDFNYQYGNSYFCLTLNTTQLEIIASGYNIARVNAYAGQISNSFNNTNNLRNLLSNNYTYYYQTSEIEITTLSGKSSKLIAKNPDYHVSFFDQILTQELQSSLFVETGGDQIPPQCHNNVNNTQSNEFEVQSVTRMNFGNGNYFIQQDDNSKYAITDRDHWFCATDLDRQQGQLSRGGAALCLYDEILSTSVIFTFYDYQQCDQQSEY